LKNILLVCTGNTCRSAMAEAIFDDEIGRSSVLRGEIRVDSAGTFACEGAEPTPNAVEVMEEMDLSLGRHRAKQIDRELVEWADLILTMEAAHFEQIEAMFPEAEGRMHTLKGFALGEEGYPGPEGFDVEDPYGEDLDFYRSCARQIRELARLVIQKLEREEGASY